MPWTSNVEFLHRAVDPSGSVVISGQARQGERDTLKGGSGFWRRSLLMQQAPQGQPSRQ